jgi:hypothetical protein
MIIVQKASVLYETRGALVKGKNERKRLVDEESVVLIKQMN